MVDERGRERVGEVWTADVEGESGGVAVGGDCVGSVYVVAETEVAETGTTADDLATFSIQDMARSLCLTSIIKVLILPDSLLLTSTSRPTLVRLISGIGGGTDQIDMTPRSNPIEADPRNTLISSPFASIPASALCRMLCELGG